jgi:hypothetical protein
VGWADGRHAASNVLPQEKQDLPPRADSHFQIFFRSARIPRFSRDFARAAMTRVTFFACGFAGLMLTTRAALAQRIRGIPIGGGDSDGTFGDAIPVVVLLLGLLVLGAVLVVWVGQMLFHGGLHGLMWTVVGMVNVYEWFRPPALVKQRRLELENKLEQQHLAEGRSRVREILRQKLPHLDVAPLEDLLDALKFTGYLRLPPGVSVQKYDPRRLGIALEKAESPQEPDHVNLQYNGQTFIATVRPADEQSA